MSWKKPAWNNMSRLQVRIIESDPQKSIIAFHQEMLADLHQRVEMKAHWKSTIEAIQNALEEIK